jgi:hypothetical protein
MKIRWLLLIIVALLVAACGVPIEPAKETPTSGAEGIEHDTSPLTEPISPVSVLPTPQLQRDIDEMILTDLRPLVAEQLNIAAEALTLVSVARVEWPDASLGCPQEGMMYAQVITPGWRVIFAGASGEEYDVHTAEKADTFVICQQAGAQSKPTIPAEFQGLTAVEAAVKMVADRRNVAVGDVSVVKVESVEWRNSCLGCAAPGQMCLTVITPGYLVVLESGGETYEIHTDRTGKVAIFCDKPAISPERADS